MAEERLLGNSFGDLGGTLFSRCFWYTIIPVLTQGHEAHLTSIGDITADRFHAYDLVCLGGPCHGTDLAEPLKKILAAIAQSPPFKMVGFATHATPTPQADERRRELYEKWAGRCADSFERTCQEKGIELLGYFSRQGAASPAIEDFIHREIVTDEEEWEAYVAEVRNHPNGEDVERAREFARAVLSEADIRSA